ncbi:MAG: hypothetical protein COB84_02780 [Rhodobacteraceae bacterium]|nr:MAG: hypothetical protein COB84_02780 [Paracoccaceae bacterium]
MKKIVSLLVILPVLCLALGYGAGEFLGKPSHEDASTAADPAHADETPENSDHTTDSNEHASDDSHAEDNKPIVVRLGQMIIPVYKAHSVTYIVTSLGVTVTDLAHAEYYNLGENGARLRDAIFAELKLSADGRALRGVSINTEKLSHNITAEVQPKFDGVSDVLFLSFYKRDVAHS